MTKRIVHFKCLLCSRTHSSRKACSGERFHFNKEDITKAPFIDIRITGLGRGKGFPRSKEKCLTFRQACADRRYDPLTKEVYACALELVQIAQEEGLELEEVGEE